MANPFDVAVVNPLTALLLGQQSYNTGIENNRKAAKEQALAEAGQMAQTGDRAGALSRLLGIGEYQGANLLNTMGQQDIANKRADREFGATQAHRAASLALQRDNQDYSPEEKAAIAVKQGLQPGSPEYLEFVLGVRGQRQNTPAGFEQNPGGGLRPIAGGPADPNYLRQKGDRQNAPSGYLWNDPNDPSKGLTAIAGGPGEKVDAEVAGRLGLAKSFLGELPDIVQKIEAGGLSGPKNTAMAVAGFGAAGELRRKMDSGAEALLRMLTGAGMNKEEAAEYTRRYKFDPKTDVLGPENAVSKMRQLDRELNSVGETVGKGRGGWSGSKPITEDEYKKLPSGSTFRAPDGSLRKKP